MLTLIVFSQSTSVPGSHASVQKLKKMFDSGKDYNLLVMDGIDPNDIATLLKLYLRERKWSDTLRPAGSFNPYCKSVEF